MANNNYRKWSHPTSINNQSIQEWTSEPSEPIGGIIRFTFNTSTGNLANTGSTGSSLTSTGSISFADSTIHSGYGQAAVFASDVIENAPTVNYLKQATSYSSSTWTRLTGNVLFTVPALTDPSAINSYFICGKARNAVPNAMRWQLEFETGTGTYRALKLRVLDNSGMEITSSYVDNISGPIDTSNPAAYNVAWEISYSGGSVTSTIYVRSDYFDTIETMSSTNTGVSPFATDLTTFPFFIGGAQFDPGYNTDSFIGTIDYLDIRNGTGNTYPSDIYYMPFTLTTVARVHNALGLQVNEGGTFKSIFTSPSLQNVYDNSTVGSKLIEADFGTEGSLILKNLGPSGQSFTLKDSNNNTVLTTDTQTNSTNVLSITSYGTSSSGNIRSIMAATGDSSCYNLRLTNNSGTIVPHIIFDGTGTAGDPIGTPTEGAFWYNSAAGKFKYSDGSTVLTFLDDSISLNPTLQDTYDTQGDGTLALSSGKLQLTNPNPITGTLFEVNSSGEVFTISNTGKVKMGSTNPLIIDESDITQFAPGATLSIHGYDYMAVGGGTFTTNSVILRSGSIEGLSATTVVATTGTLTLQSGAITNVGSDHAGAKVTGNVTLSSGDSTESTDSTTTTGDLSLLTGSITSNDVGGTTSSTGGINIQTGGFSGSSLGTTRNSGNITIKTSPAQDIAGSIFIYAGAGGTHTSGGDIQLHTWSSGNIDLFATGSGQVLINGITYPGNLSTTGKVLTSDGVSSFDQKFPRGVFGGSVASANNLTLTYVGDVFTITGSTQINLIESDYFTAGERFFLIFTGAPTVKHNQAPSGTLKPLLLAGSVDLVAAADTVLQLLYDGTSFHEVSRKQA